MNAVTLKAHFDGRHILLDEPFEVPLNAKLFITIVPEDDFNSIKEERETWLAASQAGLALAYGENEPDYSAAVLRETPPPQ